VHRRPYLLQVQCAVALVGDLHARHVAEHTGCAGVVYQHRPHRLGTYRETLLQTLMTL
jgi:hypothetical protein